MCGKNHHGLGSEAWAKGRQIPARRQHHYGEAEGRGRCPWGGCGTPARLSGPSWLAWGQDSRRCREGGFLKVVIGTKVGAKRIKAEVLGADVWTI